MSGTELRELREAAHVTRFKVAQVLGVTERTLFKIEHEEAPKPLYALAYRQAIEDLKSPWNYAQLSFDDAATAPTGVVVELRDGRSSPATPAVPQFTPDAHLLVS